MPALVNEDTNRFERECGGAVRNIVGWVSKIMYVLFAVWSKL